MALFSIALVASAALGACGGSSAPSPTTTGTGASAGGLHACSPLQEGAKPITLSTVLGAGRHADGTIYVIDTGDTSNSGYRAYVVEGGALQRKLVRGLGEVGGAQGDSSIGVDVANGQAPFSLQLERTDGVAKRMGVYRGELMAKSFEIGVQGDVLTLVGADALAGLAVRNIPDGVVTEYDATTDDGHRIFITRPSVDWKYEDFRVFYGTPDRMVERHLVTAQRGSTTFITFDLDGVETSAIFPSKFSPVGDTARLATKQDSRPLTVLTTDAAGSGVGLAFMCL